MRVVEQTLIHRFITVVSRYCESLSSINIPIDFSLNEEKRTRSCLSLFLCIGVFFTHPSQANSEAILSADVATVDFVKGYATVFPKNDSTVASFIKRDMPINEKDVIITGDDGFVSISFKTGAVVNIQPSSEVRIDLLRCTPEKIGCKLILNAEKGSINSQVERLDQNEVQFTIKTPYATAAVRGTIFDIDVSNGRLLTGVTEGQVDVMSESGSVELPENFGTKVEQNKPPSIPVPLLAAPVFLPNPVRFEGTGELTWNAVLQAVEYLVSFNSNSELVYRTRSAENMHRFAQLETGTYTLNIRAIDPEGFLGQIAERTLDIVSTNTSRTGPEVKALIEINQYSVMVEQQPGIGKLVELQFSPTGDFDSLSTIDALLGESIYSDRVTNNIYVRARGILSDTEVTPFGPILEISAK